MLLYYSFDYMAIYIRSVPLPRLLQTVGETLAVSAGFKIAIEAVPLNRVSRRRFEPGGSQRIVFVTESRSSLAAIRGNASPQTSVGETAGWSKSPRRQRTVF